MNGIARKGNLRGHIPTVACNSVEYLQSSLLDSLQNFYRSRDKLWSLRERLAYLDVFPSAFQLFTCFSIPTGLFSWKLALRNLKQWWEFGERSITLHPVPSLYQNKFLSRAPSITVTVQIYIRKHSEICIQQGRVHFSVCLSCLMLPPPR